MNILSYFHRVYIRGEEVKTGGKKLKHFANYWCLVKHQTINNIFIFIFNLFLHVCVCLSEINTTNDACLNKAKNFIIAINSNGLILIPFLSDVCKPNRIQI